jgi:hypothetical protein
MIMVSHSALTGTQAVAPFVRGGAIISFRNRNTGTKGTLSFCVPIWILHTRHNKGGMRENSGITPSHLCNPHPVLDGLVAGQARLALGRRVRCVRGAIVVPAVWAGGAPHRGIRGIGAVGPHLTVSAVEKTTYQSCDGAADATGYSLGMTQAWHAPTPRERVGWFTMLKC